MSYFEIFFYCLSSVLACGFIVHAAATLIISNLEDDSDDLFPVELTGLLPKERKVLSRRRKTGRRVVHYHVTAA